MSKIKLLNKTNAPDEVIQKVVHSAAVFIRGIKGPVVVNITRTRGHNNRIKGVAFNVKKVCKNNWLDSCQWGIPYYLKKGEKVLKTNGSCQVTLPRYNTLTEHQRNFTYGGKTPLEYAESFFWVCFHELYHIKDFQTGEKFADPINRRRTTWADRPEERRALRAEREAKEKPLPEYVENAVLELAIWLEQEGN